MAHRWEPIFDELSAQRRGRLLAFATMLGGPSNADDLVQEAVIATFSRRRGFTNVAQAEQYVRRAIASKYIDHVRRDSSARSSERQSVRTDSQLDHAEAVVNGATLDLALATLPPRVRACVVLRYLEELSIRETADTLGLSEGAVKRYVADGLKTLNAYMGTDESPDDLDNTRTSVAPKGSAR